MLNKLQLQCFDSELQTYEYMIFTQEYDEKPCIDEIELICKDSNKIFKYITKFELGKYWFVTKPSD